MFEGLFEHGFASATTDTAVITETWTKYKAADIGLALPRGVLVVDVDAAKGKRGRDECMRRPRRRNTPLGAAKPIPRL
jgi:hypothetical protein